MEQFIVKHQDKITGMISCFDRMVFKGYLPIRYAESMERFLNRLGGRVPFHPDPVRIYENRRILARLHHTFLLTRRVSHYGKFVRFHAIHFASVNAPLASSN